MFNQQTFTLSSSTSGVTFQTFSPCNLVLSLSSYISTDKIWKLSYDFGDGEIDTTRLKLLSGIDVSSPFPSEPGDPRNFAVIHNFVVSTDTTYRISASAYKIGKSDPDILYFDLKLNLPTMTDIFDDIGELRLVGSRMFGVEDRILYLFESSSPDYLLPVLADF